MSERPKEHDWKSCVPRKGTEGSNPSLCATKKGLPRGQSFFCGAEAAEPRAAAGAGKKRSVCPRVGSRERAVPATLSRGGPFRVSAEYLSAPFAVACRAKDCRSGQSFFCVAEAAEPRAAAGAGKKRSVCPRVGLRERAVPATLSRGAPSGFRLNISLRQTEDKGASCALSSCLGLWSFTF